MVNKHLSLTAVSAQAIGWHLIGKSLKFMILQYIIISGVITKIEFMHMKATCLGHWIKAVARTTIPIN